MLSFVQLLPGLIGLVVGFIASELIGWLVSGTWPLRLLVLIVGYVIVTLIADRAFRSYGRGDGA